MISQTKIKGYKFAGSKTLNVLFVIAGTNTNIFLNIFHDICSHLLWELNLPPLSLSGCWWSARTFALISIFD